MMQDQVEQLTKFNTNTIQNLNGTPFLIKRNEDGAIIERTRTYDPGWVVYYNTKYNDGNYTYNIDDTSKITVNSNKEDQTIYNLYKKSNFFINIPFSGDPSSDMTWEITMNIEGKKTIINEQEQKKTLTFPKYEDIKARTVHFFINDALREYIQTTHPTINFTIKVVDSGHNSDSNNYYYKADDITIKNYAVDFYRFNEEGELN